VASRWQGQKSICGVRSHATIAAIILVIGSSVTRVGIKQADAQTFTVMHRFTGGPDGGSPFAGLTMDRAGYLYGTAAYGGAGNGAVFEIAHRNSTWIFTALYSFAGGADGANPQARVIIGPDGALYGTTQNGGLGHGTVFRLTPPGTGCQTQVCPWTETVLYRFTGGADGEGPVADLVFDQAGNLFGTTPLGGTGSCNGNNCGVVYELTQSAGSWTHSLLWSFSGGNDGGAPTAGLVLDSTGHLYGTTTMGGLYNRGAVFQLSPAGGGWTENVLYSFSGGDGEQPVGGLILDESGNLYGTTIYGGAADGGVAYQLTPFNGIWTEARLYSFGVHPGDGLFPYDSLSIDTNHNLYGTTCCGGPSNIGTIFKLAPAGNGWTATVLHNFTNSSTRGNDGAYPFSGLIFDGNRNLYGTTDSGGTNGWGVVFELTP